MVGLRTLAQLDLFVITVGVLSMLISEPGDIARCLTRLTQTAQKFLPGGPFEVIARRPNKTREQEKKYHAQIRDIARHRVIDYGGTRVDFESYTLKPEEAAKLLLLVWFEDDLKSQGKKLRSPGQWMFDPVTNRPIYSRPGSSKLSVKEGGWFITFLDAVMAENKIASSDPATREYEEYARQAE